MRNGNIKESRILPISNGVFRRVPGPSTRVCSPSRRIERTDTGNTDDSAMRSTQSRQQQQPTANNNNMYIATVVKSPVFLL